MISLRPLFQISLTMQFQKLFGKKAGTRISNCTLKSTMKLANYRDSAAILASQIVRDKIRMEIIIDTEQIKKNINRLC